MQEEYGAFAIFPEIPSSCRTWYLCESYGRAVGNEYGYESTDYLAIRDFTRPAKPNEIADTVKWLHKDGYRNLIIRQRESSAMREKRKVEWGRLRSWAENPEDVPRHWQDHGGEGGHP